jgi:hypothetical protein
MNRRKALRGLLGMAGTMEVLRASERVDVGGATLDFFISSDESSLGNAALLDWVRRSSSRT